MSGFNVLERILAMANLTRRSVSDGDGGGLEQALSFLRSGSPPAPIEVSGQIAFDSSNLSVVVGTNQLRLSGANEEDLTEFTDVRQVVVYFQRLQGTDFIPGPTLTLVSNRTFAQNLRAVIARAAAPERVLPAFDHSEIVLVHSPIASKDMGTSTVGTSVRLQQRTFIQDLLQGRTLPSDIHQYIALWHASGSPGILADWLGLSEEEFRLWEENPEKAIKIIAAAKKHRTTLSQEFTRSDQDIAVAARGVQQNNKELAEWIQKRLIGKTDT